MEGPATGHARATLEHEPEGKDPDGPAGGDATDNSKGVGGAGEDGGENKSRQRRRGSDATRSRP